jgi:hypothetical protein
MAYLLMKSGRLCPACASSTFAPTDVPDLSNCRANVRAELFRRSHSLHNRTMLSANWNVRSTMSNGLILCSSHFAFSLLPFTFYLGVSSAADPDLSRASPSIPPSSLAATCPVNPTEKSKRCDHRTQDRGKDRDRLIAPDVPHPPSPPAQVLLIQGKHAARVRETDRPAADRAGDRPDPRPHPPPLVARIV